MSTKTYELYVYCRRNGISQDAGLHATKDAESDAEAVKYFKTEEAPWLMKWYDEVFFTVKDGDRLVTKWEEYPPPPTNAGGYNSYGDRVQKTTRSA